MADINASEFYNLGYGRQSPQIGYGRAQINRQRPMPNAPDLTQSFASGKKIRLAEDAQEQKKRTAQSELDKKVADAMSGGVYLNPILNEKWKRDVNAIKNRLGKIDKSSNPTLEIQTIIKEAEDKKAFYANQDKRYASAWDASNNIEGYYSDPFVREVQNGDYSDVPDEELDVKFNKSINVEQRLDPTKRVNEIGKPALESLFSNPNYYTVDRGEIEVGDLNEYMNKSTITPKGREYLEAILLSDQVLMDGIEQQIRFGNKPIDAQKFVQDYIDANFSRSSSQFRSEPRDNRTSRYKKLEKLDYDSVSSIKDDNVTEESTLILPSNVRPELDLVTPDGETKGNIIEVKKDSDGNLIGVFRYYVKDEDGVLTKTSKKIPVPYEQVRSAFVNNLETDELELLEGKLSEMPSAEVKYTAEGFDTAIAQAEEGDAVALQKMFEDILGGEVKIDRGMVGQGVVSINVDGEDFPIKSEDDKKRVKDKLLKSAKEKKYSNKNTTKEEPKKQSNKAKFDPE